MASLAFLEAMKATKKSFRRKVRFFEPFEVLDTIEIILVIIELEVVYINRGKIM